VKTHHLVTKVVERTPEVRVAIKGMEGAESVVGGHISAVHEEHYEAVVMDRDDSLTIAKALKAPYVLARLEVDEILLEDELADLAAARALFEPYEAALKVASEDHGVTGGVAMLAAVALGVPYHDARAELARNDELRAAARPDLYAKAEAGALAEIKEKWGDFIEGDLTEGAGCQITITVPHEYDGTPGPRLETLTRDYTFSAAEVEN